MTFAVHLKWLIANDQSKLVYNNIHSGLFGEFTLVMTYLALSCIELDSLFLLQNLTQNKRTLLPKFFGLYRYKVRSTSTSTSARV